jgi:porin
MAGVRAAAFCCAALAVLPGSAYAEETPDENGITKPSIATSLPRNGDPYGWRKSLADLGITYTFISVNDVLSNVSGGLKRGTVDQGTFETQLTLNMEKLAGWKDFTIYTNGVGIYDTGRIRRDYVGGINTIAGIEAAPSVRLLQLWGEQSFLKDKVSIRFGQLAADSEFFFSEINNNLFLQSDWPTVAAQNLPSGGPAFPLSTPGVRLKLKPNDSWTFLAAVFNGDPAGPGEGDEQQRNKYGFNFRVHDPAFMIGEAQYRVNQGKTDTGLAATYKIGAWRHLGLFPNQADPTVMHRGEYGIYGIVDQQLWRPQGAGPDKGISVFSRVGMAPSDRSQIDLEVDGGIVFAGLVPQRPDDSFGASVIYSRFSTAVRANPMNEIVPGIPGPYPDYETNLELVYSWQVVPGWVLQPDYQYIWHPSGQPGRDAQVVGFRTLIRY